MRYLALAFSAALALPASADEPKPPPKKPQHIGTLMRDTHVRGRQAYRSLDMLLVSGRSTPEERRRFVEAYTTLREMAPPQGERESWKADIDRITGIVKEMDAAKDEKTVLDAGARLLYATNCTACHEKYKYTPRPAAGEVPAKSLAAGRRAIETGGEDWSAPPSLKELGYTQPGRRVVVWPTKIEYRATGNAEKPFVASAEFNWALQPGAELPESVLSSFRQFYYHYYARTDLTKPEYKFGNFQFLDRLKPDQREGSFTVAFDLPKGGQDVAFVLLTNTTVPVPLGNLLVLKLRPPG